MTVIKDGTGRGYLAKVNNENRVSVTSITIPEIAHDSIRYGHAFQIEGETTIADGVEKTTIVLINNNDNLIAVERVFTSIRGETNIQVIIKLYLGNVTYSAAGTPKTPKNLNNTSSSILDVTVYDDNPTLGGTDTLIQEHYMEATGSQDTNYFGSIILGRGSSIRSTCTGSTGATGNRTCDVSILYYEINEDIHM